MAASGRIAQEQAALRRVAVLVAGAAEPEELFAAVAAETGLLLGTDFAVLSRYDADGSATVLASWAGGGAPALIAQGTRFEHEGRSVHNLVFETARPARIDDYGEVPGVWPDLDGDAQTGSVVGMPIRIEGRLWGLIGVASKGEQPLPAETEEWLAGFTDLVASGIANAQARVELRGYAEEQAALRRVAVLVAQAAAPEDLFAAVSAEAGQLLEADFTVLGRYDPGAITTVGVWSSSRWAALFPGAADNPVQIGTRARLGGRNVSSLVFETGRPARLDDYVAASGMVADLARDHRCQASVGVPISVDGRLWGVIIAVSTGQDPLPSDTEARLAGFTELVATAVANAQARVELRAYAEEQAALRRVATLVAQAAPPEDVFAAVSAEAGRLLEAEYTVLSRYDPDGAALVVGHWARVEGSRPLALGLRLDPGGRNLHTLVFQTSLPARIDDYGDASGHGADVARDWGFRCAVGAPISVEGRLWGVLSVASTREEALPADADRRLTAFTELVGTALANADARAALTASRARIVAAADTARRRIEHDLHDGAQQQLVSLALQVRAVQATLPPEADALASQLTDVADGLTGVLEELREIARGLHPATLARGGLRSALKALARRSAVPVELDVAVDRRLPEPVELAAYYVVAEALANAAKYADATVIDVRVAADAGVLRIIVRDDGAGGAVVTAGHGLVGLVDRVETLGGRMALRSPRGAGTNLVITLPLDR